MLIDGLNLTPTSQAQNFRLASATSFPVGPEDGEMFQLTSEASGQQPGLYYYSLAQASWVAVDSKAIQGTSSGIATLDSNGKLLNSEVPAIAFTNTYVVNSQAAMLSLNANVGDVAIRPDVSESFILQTAGASTLSHWQALISMAAPVMSVNGQTGDVVITTSSLGAVATSAVGSSNGVAGLDSSGIVPTSQLPAGVISHTYVVGSQSAMLALNANVGDFALRTDVNYSFILQTAGASTLSHWQQLLTPSASSTVTSVNSQTGDVVITAASLNAVGTSAVGAANGVAALDSSGLIPASQLPSITINNTYVVANQATMLALSANVGDIAVRTDLSESFILKTSGASTLGNWQQLLSPTSAVTSVNGNTGAVVITTASLNAVGTATLGAASGTATLDSTSKLTASQIPNAAINNTYVVASQSAMLALAANVGDLAIRSDTNTNYILQTAGASTLGHWQQLLSPAAPVTSVNGNTGAVTISTITGNAGTASALQTARAIALTGGATGTANFDGSASIGIAVTSPYDLATQTSGVLTASQVVMQFTAVRNFNLPTNLNGSYLKAATAATSSAAFTLAKNGSTFNTMTFAASSTTATMGSSAAQSFTAGDVITLTAPSSADATLASLSMSFAGSAV